MPQVFKIGPYWVYFWANESDPLEPVYVHVAEGTPSAMRQSVDYKGGEVSAMQQQLPNPGPFPTEYFADH